MNINLTTYKDLIDHITDYIGAGSDAATERFARRAALAAYREVATAKRWSYLLRRGRISTVASYDTGTVTYVNSTRSLTLADGTWPTWSAYGVVTISNITYEVASRSSGTVLLLSQTSNPGEDISTATDYTIYRDTYPLPADFVAAEEVLNLSHVFSLCYYHPSEWLSQQRLQSSPATPRIYTITGDPNYQGSMAIRMYPPPDDEYQLDFIYQARSRQLTFDEIDTGTVTATSLSTTLTGSNTAWTSSMIGSVVRLSDDSVHNPTGRDGAYPFTVERVITDVSTVTSLTMDSAAGADLTAVKYSISDPVDIEEGAMLTFLHRECERQARMLRRMKPTQDEEAQYREARIRAWENDNRSFERRAAGGGNTWYRRLADMPRGADVS